MQYIVDIERLYLQILDGIVTHTTRKVFSRDDSFGDELILDNAPEDPVVTGWDGSCLSYQSGAVSERKEDRCG